MRLCSFQYPQESIDSFLICNDIDKCLADLTQYDNDDLAVGVSRAHAMSTSLFSNHEMFCFDRSQNIANYSISLAIRNDGELISKIDKIIQNILHGGLQIKWKREHPIKTSLEKNARSNTSWSPLSLECIMFAFHFVVFPGTLLGAATFCAELWVAKRRRESNRSTIWRILSEFLDGHRHDNILRRVKHR